MANTDLDLSKIETTDYEEAVSQIESFYKKDSTQKISLSYAWERNHLMLDGFQWLVFEGNQQTGGVWKKLNPSKENQYIPRPVTNYLFDAYQTLKSYLLKNKPRITVRPNTQLHKDKSAAKLSELVSESNWERLKEAYNQEAAASILLTYGTVFKKDFWDTSYAQSVEIPVMEDQPVIDPTTGMPTGEMQQVQKLDEMGIPVVERLALGDLNTAVIEPYRISLDPLAINLHEARWIMESSIRALSWIKENYSKEDPGYTNKAEEVTEEKDLSESLRRFYNLRTSAGAKAGLNSFAGTASYATDQMIENAAVVKEYYERPCEKYPNGRMFVVANNVCLYAGDSPYSGPEAGDWHPYSEARWEIMPGRFWGKSPLDDGVELQKRINSIDSVLILTRQTMAVPQKLVPVGSVPPGLWTGQPGQEVPARPGPNGEMPQTIPASGVDNQVFMEREKAAEDLQKIMGSIDILKGEHPPGVSAAAALSLLYEIGVGKLAPALDRWKMFNENSQKKQLRIVAQRYKEPRRDFIKMLLANNKELTEDQIINFIGSDLHDNCNVVIEAASSIPKLKAAEHALLMELATTGILDLKNPANRQEFLNRFGIQGFDSDYNKDVKRAQWENDLLDNLRYGQSSTKPLVLDIDNHQLHIATHTDRMKEPSFMELPFEIQQAYFQHLQEHEMKMQEQQQLQAVQAAMTGVPPQPAQAPEAQITQGNGLTGDVKQALGGDIGIMNPTGDQ